MCSSKYGKSEDRLAEELAVCMDERRMYAEKYKAAKGTLDLIADLVRTLQGVLDGIGT